MIQNILLLEDHPDAQLWLSEALHIAFGQDIHIDIANILNAANSLSMKTTTTLLLPTYTCPMALALS